MLGTAVSAPHEQSESFDSPDASRWELVRGNMSFEADSGPTGEALTWLVVSDDDDSSGTGPSRVRVNATHTTDSEPTWNTTSSSYYYSATLENDQNYVSPSEGTTTTTTDTSAAGTTTTEGTLNVTVSADVTSGDAPLDINFTLDSNETNATLIDWSFDVDGDGTAEASGQGLPATVLHTYSTAATYEATLNTTLGNDTGNATLTIIATEATGSGPSTGGAIGLTFGESPSGGGYYMVAFTNERFYLGVPNATSGEFDIEVDQLGWGDVDPRKQDIDIRHKYTVEVDGTTVLVKVDNQRVGAFALPGVPKGIFGVIADEDMRVNVGEVHWQILDNVRPTVDLFRPRDGHIYVQDVVAVEYSPGSGPIFVQGPLTIFANITDNPGGIGLDRAQLLLNGKPIVGTRDVGVDTSMTVDTTFLSPGYHTLTVRGFDKQGNIGTDSVRIFVLGANIPSGHTVGSANELVGELIPEVPPLPPV